MSLSRSSTDDPSGTGDDKLLEVGYIVRPHGLAGDVIVHLVSNRTERVAPDSLLTGRDRLGAELCLRVVASRPHQGRFIVSFEGVSSRESADALRQTVLLAEAVEDPEAYFVHELIGCEVVDTSGASHGAVASVQENPASDLLVGEQGWLVPLRFVVAREQGRLVVDVPEGLFE